MWVAVGGALAIGGTLWSERPMMFGLLFLAVSLLAAEGRLRTGWLVLVGWTWVNVHGSFPLGLVALGALALGAHLDGAGALNVSAGPFATSPSAAWPAVC